jgi:hypothetical protein
MHEKHKINNTYKKNIKKTTNTKKTKNKKKKKKKILEARVRLSYMFEYKKLYFVIENVVSVSFLTLQGPHFPGV